MLDALANLGHVLALVLCLAAGSCSYGTRPSAITRLHEITRLSGMHFPPSARLVDGEHSTGLHPYLIAQVEMPIDAVDEYVDMQSSPFSWGRIQRGPDAESWFQMVDGSATVVQMMQRRGWQLEPGRAVLSAQANTAPTGSHLCWVVVQEGPRDAVLVYIYWEQT